MLQDHQLNIFIITKELNISKSITLTTLDNRLVVGVKFMQNGLRYYCY